MAQLVGATVSVVLIGLIAHINTGAIVGAIVAVRSSVRDAWVYAAGMTAARAIQILFGAGAVLAILSNLLGQLLLDRFIQLLLLTAGLIVLLGGIRDLRSLAQTPSAPKATEPEPTDEGPGTSGAFFWPSFALTILSPRQWLFSSLAVSTVAAARLDIAADVALTALYLGVSAWITIGLAVLRLVRPRQADELIGRVDRWFDEHMDRILAWGQMLIGTALMGLGVWLLLG